MFVTLPATGVQGSAEMYMQAIEIVENEGKAAMAGDTYRSAISEPRLTASHEHCRI